ncbi:hypothetical protein ACJIZ3_007283 [Penstemon smallii]|uniref:Uncharacterized protein n=1 Tax=Penstemon smallii TaxID=265156 RepID=A0ABD3SA31_9LAMI
MVGQIITKLLYFPIYPYGMDVFLNS